MRNFAPVILASFLAMLSSFCGAETARTEMGGDSFLASDRLVETLDAPRDTFGAAASIVAEGTVDGDAHFAGFDLDIVTDIRGDLYAAGMMVTIAGDVASDVSAAGLTIHLTDQSTIAQNTRLMGQTLTIDARIGGALSAAADHVVLNGSVAGDAWITAERITFGPDAQIEGTLSYASPDPIVVSQTVVPAERVRIRPWTGRGYVEDLQQTFPGPEMPVFDNVISLFWAALISIGFLLIIGAIFLVFMPNPVAAMRREILSRPAHVTLLGILGLAMLFGLLPVTALTIIGLPFVPFGILLIVVVWTLGYLLGAYAAAMRIYQAFGGADDPALGARLLVLLLGLCLVTLLNYIPFVGWVINYTLVLIGTGAMTGAVLLRIIGPLATPVEGEMLGER